jgi:ELWxxDGT repeat protein
MARRAAGKRKWNGFSWDRLKPGNSIKPAALWRSRAAKHRRLSFEELETRCLLSLSVGDLVWNDVNSNGVQDVGEPGISGAVVEIFQTADTTIGNTDDVSVGLTTSDSNGNYSLGGLAAGANYYLVFRPPVGFGFTQLHAGANGAVDSDANSTGCTSIITLAAGANNVDIDAGLTGAYLGFGYAMSAGGTANDYGQSVAVDASGNVYVTGSFQNTIDFDPGIGTDNLTSMGSSDVFVAKYTNVGVLCWARGFGSSSSDNGQSITVAQDGCVYVTGSFTGTVDFNPGAGVCNLSSVGGTDIFVLKLDTMGKFLWADRMGGTTNDFGYGIAIGADGNVYTTGAFWGTVDFDPGIDTYYLTGPGNYDIFVSKLDSSGKFLWADCMGGVSTDIACGIAVSPTGDVYTTGYFLSAADFDPGSGTHSLVSRGDYDIFVSKLDSAGNYQWAERFGYTGADMGTSIAVDSNSNVYVTGSFQLNPDFDPGSSTYNLVSAGLSDIFVLKLNSIGDFSWADGMGGVLDDYAYGLALDPHGNVSVIGNFKSTADFDPGAGTCNLTASGALGSSDIFISMLDNAGNFVSARQWGGTASDTGYGIALDSNGDFYATGCFAYSIDSLNLTSAGGYDILLSHIRLNDRAPSDISLSPSSVMENSPTGTTVGRLNAYDPDSGDVFTYQLLDSAGGRFKLSDSQIQVDNGTLIDYFTAHSYNIKVRATDYYRRTYDKTLSIAVTEAPNKSTLGDLVWIDANGNGIQDAGEPGLGGVAVELYCSIDATIGNADDYSYRQTVANSNGAYSFPDVISGQKYYLAFRLPVGYIFTAQNAGGDTTLDSDANSSGLTPLLTLAPSVSRTDIDAGVIGVPPSFGIALSAGGTSNDSGQSIALDAAGNIYVTGSFQGTADFDPGVGVYNLTSAGQTDIFIAKYSNGGELCWARRIGAGNNDVGNGIAIGSDGGVYVTGSFYGTVDFDPGPGIYNLTSAGYDAFVLKLDSAGKFVWAGRMGGTGDDVARGIAIAPDGCVYTTGSFSGTADFDPGAGTFNLTSTGSNDIFVVKLDSAGNFAWADRMGGSSNDYGYAIAVATDGSVCATGAFASTADFDPGTGTFNLTSTGSNDIFVVKLDSAGKFAWADRMGGSSNDYGYAIAVVPDGSVCVTGTFASTADFDPGAGTFNLASAGSNDIFVVKLNSTGNFAWADRMGGSNSDYVSGIALAPDGGIYTTGYFSGTADFDPGSGVFNLISAGGNDIFISKLDNAGKFASAIHLGGTSDETSNSIVLDQDGNAFTTGNFWHTANFDPRAGTFNLVSNGGSDIFICKLSPDSAPSDLGLTPATVQEGSLPGTLVGQLTATDPDLGESFTYELLDSAGGRFQLSGSQILVKNGRLLDYSQAASHNIVVRVRDYLGAALDKTLTIAVTEAANLSSLGDLVWNDGNDGNCLGNGIQDPGEPGIAGAAVELFYSPDATIGNSDDISMGQVVTDASGRYSFSNLTPGTNYYLVVRAPAGFNFTAQNVGGDAERDSDVNASGVTPFLTIPPSTQRTDIDAGLCGSLPAFAYAIGIGSFSSDSGTSIATDSAGNFYVTGTCVATMDFDPGPGTCYLGGFTFIAKYTSAGALCWARALGNSGTQANSITIGPDGGVYVTGLFSGTVNFDPGANVHNLASAGNSDIFILKLDSSGNFVWADRMGGTGADVAYGIAVDAGGCVYTTGSFNGVADFDPGAGTCNLTSAGSSDIFVSKLDSAGNFVWADRMGGTGADGANGIAVDAGGCVYTTGSFNGTADFDPAATTFNLTCAGKSSDIFVSKLDSSGNFVWADRMGGTGADGANGIAVDAGGCVYTTGYFNGNADFDPSTTTFNLTSAGSCDVFVSKLDSSGNFVWADCVGGSYDDHGNGIAVAGDGSLFVTGYYTYIADFDPGVATYSLVSSGGSDVFVLQLSSAGGFIKAFSFGGTSNDFGNAIALDPSGNVFTTGNFSGTADFDPGPGVFNVTSKGNTDIYVSKLRFYNRAPTGLSLAPATVQEHSLPGTVVGTLTASDPDPGDILTYELIDSAGGRFRLDGSQIVVANGTLLDHTQSASVSIIVRVTDFLGSYCETTLPIAVVEVPTKWSVGDRVWKDIDGNGLQDPGEPGMAAVAVELFASTDATIGNADDFSLGQTVTDADGKYKFTEIVQGMNYYLVFRPPVGFTFTTQNVPGDAALDSDADVYGATSLFAVVPGAERTDIDAGLVGTAPSFGFAASVSGSSSSTWNDGRRVITDAAGNIYVSGLFSSTADFDPGPGVYNLTSAEQDTFIAKYTSGGALCWAVKLFAPDSGVMQIAAAPDGGVLIAGCFSGTKDFDPGPGIFNLTCAGSIDIFVSKLDSSGAFVWAKQIGGTGSDFADCIATSADGDIYLTGKFQNTVDFDPGSGVYYLSSSPGNYCCYLLKLTSSGSFIWADSLFAGVSDIAVAADESVYIAGGFSGNIDFNPQSGTYYLASAGQNDIYVSKLDSSGSFVWAKRIGGTSNDCANGIAAASDGSIYLTGGFDNTVDFDPGLNVCYLTSAGGDDIFVAKLNSDGNLLWARGTGGTNDDYGSDLAVATDGSVYVLGEQGGNDADLNPGPADFHFEQGAGSFILKLDGAGNFVLAAGLFGSQNTLPALYSYGCINSIALSPTGDVITTGYFRGRVDFDLRASEYYLTSGDTPDIFIAKWTTPLNHPPTDIGLSSTSVPSHARHGYVVADLTTVDPDSNDAFSYTLLDSAGRRFLIDGTRLVVNDGSLLDYNQATSCQITIQTTDWFGISYEKTFTIDVVPYTGSWSIGDRVWYDANGNGVQDPGEPGIAGIVVEVMQSPDGVVGNGDDASWGATVTDSTGHYSLGGLATGLNYYVTFRAPIGYSFTSTHVGTNGEIDSDADAAGYTKMFSFGDSGPSRVDIDAGLRGAALDCNYTFALAGSIVSSSVIDAAGNTYITGSFYGTVDFDPGPAAYGMTGIGREGFIAKYRAGGALEWIRTLDGPGWYSNQLAVGPSGAVYLLSNKSAGIGFSGGVGPGGGISQEPLPEASLWKLDAGGNFLWANERIDLDGWGANNLAVSTAGSVYLTGCFRGATDFDPGPDVYSLSSAGGKDVFICELDGDGKLVWAESLGGSVDDEGRHIALRPDGGICIAGTFGGTVDINPGPESSDALSSSGDTDNFILSLDAAGKYLWARDLSDTSYVSVSSIAVAADGGVYIAGDFKNSVDFNPGPYNYTLTSAGDADAYVQKLNSSGKFAWAAALGGTEWDIASDIAVGPDGSVYIAGTFNGTADFDPGAGVYNLTSAGGEDAFISVLDSTGGLVWSRAVGSTSDDFGSGIYVASDGSIYTTGSFTGTVDFDPTAGAFNLTSVKSDSSDFFFSKIGAVHAPTGLALSPASVAENSPSGTLVGQLSATDAVPGESFTYELLDSAGGRFKLSGSRILVDNSTLLDYETSHSHDITVRVWNSMGAAFTKTIAISVTDVFDSPNVPPATNPRMLADINTTIASIVSSNPTDIVDINGFAYFTAVTDSQTIGLFRSDGTTAGTVLLKEFVDRDNDYGFMYGLNNLTNVNGTLFFAANDGTHGNELWKSDGSIGGTVMVKDIFSLMDANYGYTAVNSSSDPDNLTNVAGTLFFTVCDSDINYHELWKSDGTASGTVCVRDFDCNQYPSGPCSHANIGGEFFFTINDGTHGYELWKSDGTTLGTTLVKDIDPGVYGSFPGNLTAVGGTLFFSANDGTHGYALWKSDGTTVGTTMVKDINPGVIGYGSNQVLNNLTAIGGTLFFSANDGTHGYELWKSDGTETGTVMVKNINPGSTDYYGKSYEASSDPNSLTNLGGMLFFSANDGAHGRELWKSDGTAAGTVMVKNINFSDTYGYNPSADSFPNNLVNVGGMLYFSAYDYIYGNELWKSDGTAAGTTLVKDINGIGTNSYPANLTNVGGVLFFTANDGAHGYELWKSNGSESGTTLVKDIYSCAQGSAPGNMVNVSGTLFFTANDGTHGYELWKSDGTHAETVISKTFTSIDNLTNVGGTLFFFADDNSDDLRELWKSDGTAAKTVLVKDFGSGIICGTPSALIHIGGAVFFIANDRIHGFELWKSDGTTAGTVLVKDIHAAQDLSKPRYLTQVGGTLFFSANDGTHGWELWKSDGTEAGTVLVKDINTLVEDYGSFPANLVNVNGTLFFMANDGTHGAELWKSDGTASGTVLVKDINPGANSALYTTFYSSYTPNILDMGGTLFFCANDGAHGFELWKSDGTETGTVLVEDIGDEASYSSYINRITNVSGTLFFIASRSNYGRELWKSDGTAAGTVMVKDIRSGDDNSNPAHLTNVGGVLFFSADDGKNGSELWTSDGTEAGTLMVKDIKSSNYHGSAYLGNLTAVGGRLFFTADDGIHGVEPWVLDVDVTAPRVAGVYVKGTTWNNALLDYFDSSGLGCSTVARLGYAIPAGADQLKTLPWTGINTISVQFDENVSVAKANLALLHTDFTPFDLSGATFSYNSTTYVATWTLPQTISADVLTLAITSVADTIGNALDGEWIDQTSPFPSGNGAAGGDFVFHFNVLPGDVNQDGSVNAADRNAVKYSLGSAPGDDAYSPLKDLSGDGLVISNDLVMVLNNLGTKLQTSYSVIATGDSGPVIAAGIFACGMNLSSDSPAAIASPIVISPPSQTATDLIAVEPPATISQPEESPVAEQPVAATEEPEPSVESLPFIVSITDPLPVEGSPVAAKEQAVESADPPALSCIEPATAPQQPEATDPVITALPTTRPLTVVPPTPINASPIFPPDPPASNIRIRDISSAIDALAMEMYAVETAKLRRFQPVDALFAQFGEDILSVSGDASMRGGIPNYFGRKIRTV